MFKQKWKFFADRFSALKISRAEAVRATGLNYSRLVGFLNGYWDLNETETKKVDDFLNQKEAGKND